MIVQTISRPRPFFCFSRAIERIIDKKVQGAALSCLERLVDWVMTSFSSTYRSLYSQRIGAVAPLFHPLSAQLVEKIGAAESFCGNQWIGDSTLEERLWGTLEGQAVGDALGLLTEFETAPSAQAMIGGRHLELALKEDAAFRNGPRGAHRNAFPPGWTDDTDQYILGVRARWLKENNPRYANIPLSQIFAHQLNHWFHHGLDHFNRQFTSRQNPACRGLGRLVGALLIKPHFTTHPEQAAREAWLDPTLSMGPGVRGRPAPNGALMRTGFVGALHFEELRKVVEESILFSKVTHADPRSIASAVTVSVAIALFLRGRGNFEEVMQYASNIGKQVLFDELARSAPQEPVEGYLHEFDEAFRGDWNSLQLDQGGIGYTYKCMGAAFHALRLAHQIRLRNPEEPTVSFRAPMEELIAQGGDADTNGAVAGALMGAYLGRRKIPASWLAALPDRDVLNETRRMITHFSRD